MDPQDEFDHRRREPFPIDDEDDSGLGPAFDKEPDEDAPDVAPPLSDDQSDFLLQRFLEIEQALVGRWPESKLEPSLDRVSAVCDLLGNPQNSCAVIHIAGTNGKTSTSRMIESLLRMFGLRTGLYTSPHLHSVRERIRLDGEPIDIERFVRIYEDVAPYLEIVDQRNAELGAPRLSFFEAITCMGFAAFADAPVDVAVLEVGMGGRWDATNVATAQVAVVMPIGLDHVEYLGADVATISVEKAGVIKPESTAVLARQSLDAAEVLLARCVEVGAVVAREGLEFEVVSRAPAVGGQVISIQGLAARYDDIFLPLFGAHQAANAAAAVAAVEAFLGGGTNPLSIDLIRAAFGAVVSPGRLEAVRRNPTVLVDAAHNPHGAQALAAAIQDSFDFTHLVGVIAVLGDKDARGLLEALDPVLAEVVISSSSSPRARAAETLAILARDVFGSARVHVVDRMSDAVERAIELAELASLEHGGGAGVLITGSVVTAAEGRSLLGRGEA